MHASAFSVTLRTTLIQLWGPLELSLCNVARLEACTSDMLKGREFSGPKDTPNSLLTES